VAAVLADMAVPNNLGINADLAEIRYVIAHTVTSKVTHCGRYALMTRSRTA
jgi:hypothetical protein